MRVDYIRTFKKAFLILSMAISEESMDLTDPSNPTNYKNTIIDALIKRDNA